MIDKQGFYNQFHKNTTRQLKLISKNNYTYITIIKNITKILNKLPKSSYVLDYGCGAGTLSFYISSLGYKVTGVDLSPKAIEVAQESSKLIKLNNIKFLTLDKFKSQLPTKYNLIICLEVIEHVENDKLLLKILSSYLKSKGYLYLSTPSINAPLYRLGMLNEFDKQVGHIRRYPTTDICEKIGQSGLHIIELSKEEGILRNTLFTQKPFGLLVRYIRGPVVTIFTYLDKLLVNIFGESNIHVIAKKP